MTCNKAIKPTIRFDGSSGSNAEGTASFTGGDEFWFTIKADIVRYQTANKRLFQLWDSSGHRIEAYLTATGKLYFVVDSHNLIIFDADFNGGGLGDYTFIQRDGAVYLYIGKELISTGGTTGTLAAFVNNDLKLAKYTTSELYNGKFEFYSLKMGVGAATIDEILDGTAVAEIDIEPGVEEGVIKSRTANASDLTINDTSVATKYYNKGEDTNPDEWFFDDADDAYVTNGTFTIPDADVRCFVVNTKLPKHAQSAADRVFALGESTLNRIILTVSETIITLHYVDTGGTLRNFTYSKDRVLNKFSQIGVKINYTTNRVGLYFDGNEVNFNDSYVPEVLNGVGKIALGAYPWGLTSFNLTGTIKRFRMWLENVDMGEVMAGTETQTPYTDWDASNTNSANDLVTDVGSGLQDGVVDSVETFKTLSNNIGQYVQCDVEGWVSGVTSSEDYTNGLSVELEFDLDSYSRDKNDVMFKIQSGSDVIQFYKTPTIVRVYSVIGGVTNYDSWSNSDASKIFDKRLKILFVKDSGLLSAYLNGVPIGTPKVSTNNFTTGALTITIGGGTGTANSQLMKAYKCKYWNSNVDPLEALNGSLDSSAIEIFDSEEATATNWTGSNGSALAYSDIDVCYPWTPENKAIERYFNFVDSSYIYGALTGRDFSNGFALETDIYFGRHNTYAQRHVISKLYWDASNYIDIVHVTDTVYRFRINAGGVLTTEYCTIKWANKMYSHRTKVGIAHDGSKLYGTVNGIPIIEGVATSALPSTPPTMLLNAVNLTTNDYSKPSKYYGSKVFESYKNLFEVYRGDHDSDACDTFTPDTIKPTEWESEQGLTLDTIVGAASVGDPFPWIDSGTPIQQYLQCAPGGYPQADLTDIDFTNGFSVESKMVTPWRPSTTKRIIHELYKDASNRANIYWESTGDLKASIVLAGSPLTLTLDKPMASKTLNGAIDFMMTHDGTTFEIFANGISIGSGTKAGAFTTGFYLRNNANNTASYSDISQLYGNKIWNGNVDAFSAHKDELDASAVEIFDYKNALQTGLIGSNGHTVTFNGDAYLKC